MRTTQQHSNVTQKMKSHNLSTERHICVFGVLEHKASHFSDLFFVCIIFCAIAIFSSFTSIVVTLSGAYTNSTSNDYTAAAAAATAVVATAPYIRNTFFAIVFCTSFFSQNISHGRTHAFVYTIDDEIVHYMCCIEREMEWLCYPLSRWQRVTWQPKWGRDAACCAERCGKGKKWTRNIMI